jgi:predicted metal-dependent hydrolase
MSESDWPLALEEAVPRDVFRAEVSAWARRIGVEPKEVHMRPMSRKWGSCSTNGRVTFNAELLCKSAAFRRRVIVEELLHLKVPNHGKLFKSLLRAYLGDDEMAGAHGRASLQVHRIITGDQSSLPILQDQPSSVPDDSADVAC